MAKVAMIQRELKREKLAAKYAAKYAELKAIAGDAKRSDEERDAARLGGVGNSDGRRGWRRLGLAGAQPGGAFRARGGRAMTLWTAILLACAATYLTKLAGYAVPARWLQNPRMARVAGAITVALLSALTVMNTFAAGTALVIDARLAALGVAALALWQRLPFLLVVLLGGAAAGVVRWWG